jgi:hypothetical protein
MDLASLIRTPTPKAYHRQADRERVEIIVDYRQKIPYRYRVQRQNERILDFKGFFFKNSSRIEDEKKEK